MHSTRQRPRSGTRPTRRLLTTVLTVAVVRYSGLGLTLLWRAVATTLFWLLFQNAAGLRGVCRDGIRIRFGIANLPSCTRRPCRAGASVTRLFQSNFDSGFRRRNFSLPCVSLLPRLALPCPPGPCLMPCLGQGGRALPDPPRRRPGTGRRRNSAALFLF